MSATLRCYPYRNSAECTYYLRSSQGGSPVPTVPIWHKAQPTRPYTYMVWWCHRNRQRRESDNQCRKHRRRMPDMQNGGVLLQKVNIRYTGMPAGEVWRAFCLWMLPLQGLIFPWTLCRNRCRHHRNSQYLRCPQSGRASHNHRVRSLRDIRDDADRYYGW